MRPRLKCTLERMEPRNTRNTRKRASDGINRGRFDLGLRDMTTTRDTGPARLRFSISQLFAATTLVAIALAATFGPRWDAEERWIIGSWFLGALGMAAIARARGQRGLLSSVLGGGLLPGAVAFAIPILQGVGRAHGPWDPVIAVTIFVTVCGAALAALALLLYERALKIWQQGLLPSVMIFLSRWRPPAAWTGIPIGIALALAWLASSATWRERVTIEFYGSPENAPNLPVASSRYPAGESSNESTPDIALTTGGTLVAACGYHPDAFRRINGGASQQLDLWETTWPSARHAGSRDYLHRFANSADFSPDGKLLAVTNRDTVAVWNTLTGEEFQVVFPPLQHLAIPPTQIWLSAGRFSLDGTTIMAKGWNSMTRDVRLYTWDAKSLELIRQESFPGFHTLEPNHSRTRIARVAAATTQVPAERLELIDAQSYVVKRTWYEVFPGEQPIFSPDDKLLAHGWLLRDLDAGTQLLFPGPIRQFVSGGRRVVVLHHQPRIKVVRDWLHLADRLPIVRHWLADPWLVPLRLELYDTKTGKLIASSRPQGAIESVTVSRNGRVVATATRKGQIRIWDVPE